MHGTNGLDPGVQTGLGVFYVICALLNLGFWWFQPSRAKAVLWLGVIALYVVLAAAYFGHLGWAMPPAMRELIDTLANPVSYFVGSLAAFAAFLTFRKFFTEPHVAWALLNLLLLFGGISMTDPSFQSILTKPDNLPIPMLIFSVGFLTWL